MDVSDRALGKFVLGTTTSIFLLLIFWINTYPFIDEETSLYLLVPDPKWFLLFSGTWGLIFIGGVMSYTVYHLYAYL